VTRAAWLVAVVVAAGCAPQRGTIGAVLAQDRNQHLFVREVPDGLGADRAGLEPGDEILTIDGQDARAMTVAGVHDALSGEVGEPVRLTVIRRGNVVRLTVKRTPAKKYSVKSSSG